MTPLLRRALIPIVAIVTAIGVTAAVAPQAVAAPTPPPAHSTVEHTDHQDVSAPLASITPASPTRPSRRVYPLHPMPQRPQTTAHDPVVQAKAVRMAAVPTVNANFDGIGQGNYAITGVPPDPDSAVGATQVVEVVNTALAVYSKTGGLLYGPANTNTLWSGFGGSCQTTNDGDAVVRYDTLAGRWVVTQFANVTSASGPYYECVAVSQTSDATGAYNRYSFQYSSFPDYPKLSVWPDAYYVTYNLFNSTGTTFLGTEACAMDRAKMLSGQTATQQCFTTSTAYGSLLPADLDGTAAPPSGEPNTLVALGTTSTSLVYWKFHVDWTTPASTTFTGPTTLAVASYSAMCGTSGTCVPQSQTTQTLDSIGDRLMFRLAYRNMGDHESLVVNHSVGTGVRWYELRLPGGNPTVFQQGTYSPDATYRWTGSVAMDKVGNIALGYTASSSSIHPEIRFTGRLAADPAGQMTQGEGTIVAGSGSQTTYSRWGDYSSMSVDPGDGCTFWYTHEYIPANGNFNWRTRLASFQLPNCAGPAQNNFSIAASPTSGTVTAGGSVTATVSTQVLSGSAESVALSATGLPSGATASFNPASVTAGNSSTMTITTSGTTPQGTYPITITGTAPSATHTTSFSLTVNPTGGGGLVNGTFEAGNLSGWTTAGTTAVTTSGPHGGTYAALVGATPGATNGDSSIAQTFTVPSGMGTLSFWYNVTCPDSVTYDWATATLKDNTSGTTSTVVPKTCTNNNTWVQAGAPVTAGHSYTLTLAGHDDNYSGDGTAVKYDDVALAAGTSNPIANGTFEAGNLSGWTTAGTTAVTTSAPHGGTYAALTGATPAGTNGDSSIAQTFTPSAAGTLSFWYNIACPDTVTYDWATATLRDNTAGTTTTVLAKTCTNTGTWQQKTAAVTGGHSYTLTLVSHDDNYNGDGTAVKYDDIAVS
ncbi:MAG: hypothetical protein JWQ95_3732 [Sphaerisporangium sp.]|nr:hypothetical protein [Sphaerisporangium sp.]